MTRTTDPDDHERFQPLGAPIPRSPPPPPAPKPQGEYGLITGPDGRLKTTRNPAA